MGRKQSQKRVKPASSSDDESPTASTLSPTTSSTTPSSSMPNNAIFLQVEGGRDGGQRVSLNPFAIAKGLQGMVGTLKKRHSSSLWVLAY